MFIYILFALALGLGTGLYADVGRPLYLKIRYRKHPEKAEEARRKPVREHLQACVSKLEYYKKYLPLTRQTAFEFSVGELVSIKTRDIHAEGKSIIEIGKGNKARSGV